MSPDLGCAIGEQKVRLKGRVWPYSPGPVDPVRRVDPRLPRLYSGPEAGRYGQTRTASAVVR